MSSELAPIAPDYAVSVRALCAFTAKTGDLDLRFTPSPTAQEGMAGHKIVAARRPAPYEREVTLAGRCDGVAVRGRADGFDPLRHRLEEFKTHRGPLSRIPENHRQLHWAQAETYAHLKCLQSGLDRIEASVVYFDIGSQVETPVERSYAAQDLEALFLRRCKQFAAWAAGESAHREARDLALTALAFPHAEFRGGQRQMAEAVYRAARDGTCLMAQAPTGIGKTLAALFPALKALGLQKLEKVFFLTAKRSGRRLAMESLRTLTADGRLPLRVIELSARETLCEHPDKACHGDSCPLARGFYDRLPDARAAAMREPLLDPAHIRATAQAFDVCPYYLAQELVRWSDVVVGDYNHYFDASASLHAATVANEWKVAVLVDEAHNMIERGRAMYSGELRRADLRAASKAAPAPVRRALAGAGRRWQALAVAQTSRYQASATLPAAFIDALASAVAAIADLQAESLQPLAAELLQFFFDALHFTRLAETFGAHSIFDGTLADAPSGTRATADLTLSIRNVVPAPHLAPRVAGAHATVFFSATFAPAEFYRRMLGLPERTVALDVESPFGASQLSVRVAGHISTRWGDRGRSLGPIAALIGAQFDAAPGNYIAFFSSFDYLAQAADELARRRPDLPAWRQSQSMSDDEQAAFVDRFSETGQGIGFAVLGGRFGEGIDLPGRRLVGAFIATLGLPQINPVNEEMRRLMAAQFGAGYEYTYLYPGLRKVVQAAGRVIRTNSDRGVVHLIDARYAEPRIRRLLPTWWDLSAGDRRTAPALA